MDIRHLTPRLGIIADEFRKRGPQNLFYDIGTDHAYLPIHLVSSGICETAEASDARVAPIEKARRNVERHGLSDRIKLTVGDGFSAFSSFIPGKIAVIAGIGGQNIADILEAGEQRARLAAALIIQPMNNQEILREYLAEHGYNIVYERLACEERRVYSVFVCEWVGIAVAEKYMRTELYTGKRVFGSAGETRHFLCFTLKKVMNRYNGLRQITTVAQPAHHKERDYEELAQLEEVINAIKDIIPEHKGLML